MPQRVRFQFCAIAIAIISLYVRPVQAQCGGAGQITEANNSGTEFLLCFEQNDVPDRQQDDDGYLELYIAATNDTSTVTITSNRYPSMNRVFHLLAHGAMTYRVSTDTIQYHGTQRLIDTTADLWITSQEQPDGRVVRVTSTTPIVCYGMNHKVNTTDAFLALPHGSAGTEYRIMSYPNSALLDAGGTRRPSQFAVAAFDDNTTVTIIPSARTSSGHLGGVPFSVTINSGECVQVQADLYTDAVDLTGSEVRADHPVAVYGSHARAEIPYAYQQLDGTTSRDHLSEALPPVGVWGKAFVLSAFDIDAAGNKRPEGDLMRVLALNDNTKITVNGVPWQTINHDRFADSLIHGPVLVETSGPALVAEYSHTSTVSHDLGDPSMSIVPSVDETYNDYTLFASSDPAFGLHKVIIAADMKSVVSDTSAKVSTIVADDNLLLPSAIFTPLPPTSDGRHFGLTELGISAGVHTLRSNRAAENGFTILVYGFGQVDSYGYTAGLLLKPLRALMATGLPLSAGRQHSNEITFWNVTNENVYMDSAVVSFEDNTPNVYGIHSKENVAFDPEKIYVGGKYTLHLTAKMPLPAPVSGTVKIYGHTPKWWGLEPAVVPFTLYPEALAAVGSQGTTRVSLENYPNPFISSTTIAFSLPERGDLTMKVYDQLGRTVSVLASGEYSAGPMNVHFERQGLAAGIYTCEIHSDKLGIQERRAMVIGD